jgi:hypothetical protein
MLSRRRGALMEEEDLLLGYGYLSWLVVSLLYLSLRKLLGFFTFMVFPK